ncbi:hypothetical protein [Algoriphagus sp. CAU 1675]|uniref:hypothetical protein n=1 Tax=Algoriphagus sp. CAU 1675 TaxID=3032597 RepID=UPI0023D99D2D|nr:hypothetical protein [Algoriphagus sp. CAU 1675]MDF2156672.1 hypothetical protein [Algoriphagus sp. CAU 1675]
MKKCFLFFLSFMLLSFGGFAQLEKGNKVIGGSINFSSQSSEASGPFGVSYDTENRNFELSPDFGIFIIDNLVLGLTISYFNRNFTMDYTNYKVENLSSGWGAGPYIRKYFPLGEQFAFFGQLGISFSGSSEEYKNENIDTPFSQKSKYSVFGAKTDVGFSFFPKKWISLNLMVNPLNFTQTINKPENNPDNSRSVSNNFSFNVNTSSILLGAHFFISKK